MRNPVANQSLLFGRTGAFSSAVLAQTPEGQAPRVPPPVTPAVGVPAMPNPPGPAPKHDLTGAWVGPQKTVLGPFPAMTPAGQATSNSQQASSVRKRGERLTRWPFWRPQTRPLHDL